MSKNKSFKISVTSAYGAWWMYNLAATCGCFDADSKRIGFASAQRRLAEVGDNLDSAPQGFDPSASFDIVTPECDSFLLYLYIIPHTLPSELTIRDNNTFDIKIDIYADGTLLRQETRKINIWSGASIELKSATSPQP